MVKFSIICSVQFTIVSVFSFILALIVNSSDIAFLIPPSIGMIIYGVVSKSSIPELFIAGIGPGLLILVMFSILVNGAAMGLRANAARLAYG